MHRNVKSGIRLILQPVKRTQPRRTASRFQFDKEAEVKLKDDKIKPWDYLLLVRKDLIKPSAFQE